MSNISEENIPYSFTYDDVLLLPRFSQILPQQVSLETRLTKNIKLKCPLASSAMDTVTEAATAITMAHAGGIGIIHKNLDIPSQADEVRKVKRSESGMVFDPFTISPQNTIGEAVAIMKDQNISGVPVVENNELVGIVTGRDIIFVEDFEQPVSQVMTKDLVTTPKGTTFKEAMDILSKHRIEKLPVVEGKKLVGLFTIRDIKNTRRYPDAAKDSSGRLLAGAAIGPVGDFLDRSEALLKAGVDVLVIDTAHAHTQTVLNAVKTIKDKFSPTYDFDLIAGNCATGEAAKALAETKKVDAIKVGIGPGSICTTRIIAGVGVPQFSAVLQCANVAKKYNVPIIADGGIKFSGDIVKSLAAGAECVMLGSLLAGTEEAPGDIVIFQGKSYKSYRGMGSIKAMQRGSKDRYGQADIKDNKKLVPEGIEGRVPYRGKLIDTLYQLTGGIKAGMGYVGAPDIPSLQKDPKFTRITNAGLHESHVHDVYITHEAPNYKLD